MVITTLALWAVVALDGNKSLSHDNKKPADRGWEFVRNDPQKWDSKKMVSVDGKVVGIIQSSSTVSLMVKGSNGTISIVDLGPKKYFDAQATHLKMKDTVAVKGSKVMQDGRGSVLCSELGLHGYRIAFRTQTGRPLW